MTHKYTTERIFHYTCGECRQPWSYASVDDCNFHFTYEMNCPHCGYQTTMEPKNELIEEFKRLPKPIQREIILKDREMHNKT